MRRTCSWAKGSALLSLPLVMLAPMNGAAAEEELGTLISLHADSTSVVEILDTLAERSGLNIVTGPSVQGRHISIRMRESPFESALNLVCRASGLGYERVGNSILVADPQRLAAPTGRSAHVFDIDYASARQVKEALEVITPDVRADVETNRIVMLATQSNLELAGRAVAELDRKPRQVLLEARLIEVNTTELLEVGIDWEKLTKWTGILTENKPDPSPPGQLPDRLGYVKLGDGERFYRQFESYELAIDALVTEGHARLLANTKVVTLDGKPAEIFAGETVPVIITSLQASAGTGVLQTVQLEKIDVGVRLDITPRITDDGLITTLVEPEVSRIVAFVGPDDDLPQTSTRRARSIVRVRDGERIYLGGLLSEETRKTVKKVPLLGHIPILGHLFSHTREEVLKLDLLIEITPHIVDDVAASFPPYMIPGERPETDADPVDPGAQDDGGLQ